MSDIKKITVDWQEGYFFIGKDDKGLSVNFDISKEQGGTGKALSPMQILLASLGSCVGIGIVRTLQKKRQSLTGFRVELGGTRSEEEPKPYASIIMNYIIKGKSIRKEAVEEAIKLTEEKYCSVRGTLRKTISITSSYEIINE
jgi:putative redox protein